ncbi:Fungal Zn(2)-Cys(6) binuclear cluster domain [Ceratobasidium sp. AG-Ba]|nr:Fungal Zn(2)-Cys(6) binuclear cluster domain [Ceratobasidium sp. AG-Ba]QRW12909.1 Fungal Zn(2)-Cys(6) binuclear cluster domain [Ceratobasidium sp. AG-Ba]
MVVTHESAPPKQKPKAGASSSTVPGKEKRLRSKEGCLTCRIRGKKCDQGKNDNEDAQTAHPGCAACRRLRIECLGYARNRPEWLKGPQVDEFKRTIKMFLAENSPRVQRTPRTSDSGSLPFLTFDSLRNGAATSFVPVASASTSAPPPPGSPGQAPPDGQDPGAPSFNPPPPIPPTYAQYQVPMQFGPPPQHQQLPGHPIQAIPHPHTLPPIHDPSQIPPPAAGGIPLDPALAIDPALEDANMQTLAPVLAQLGVTGRLRPQQPAQPDQAAPVAVGYTVSHDRGTPPASAPVPASTPGDALHDIGVRVLEVLVAGGKPVDDDAARAWSGVVGASPAWGEVVVEIVAVTRGPPPAPMSAPPAEDLDRIGSDALRACALLCLGVPGSEVVLAKRLEERRWGEDVAETGVAENWQRASEVFVGLAAANISGAAEAAHKLEAREANKPEIKPDGEAMDTSEDNKAAVSAIPTTLTAPPAQEPSAAA